MIDYIITRPIQRFRQNGRGMDATPYESVEGETVRAARVEVSGGAVSLYDAADKLVLALADGRWLEVRPKA